MNPVITYWPALALIIGLLNLTVLLWAVSTAFWSISRTMKETRKLWSESEDALSRLKALIGDLEDRNDRRKF